VVAGRRTHRVYELQDGVNDEALYTGAAQPYGEIFVMKCDGTEVEQLTDNQWEEGAVTWQPHQAIPHAATVPR
jgi:hypothetical protein